MFAAISTKHRALVFAFSPIKTKYEQEYKRNLIIKEGIIEREQTRIDRDKPRNLEFGLWTLTSSMD